MANQYEADPRQLDFLERYFNHTSETYSKLVDSLVAAGYSPSYADSFQKKQRVWVQESARNVTKQELVTKAKKVLDKSLDSTDEKLAQDTAKFVAKTDIEFAEKVDPDSVKPQEILVRFVGSGDE